MIGLLVIFVLFFLVLGLISTVAFDPLSGGKHHRRVPLGCERLGDAPVCAGDGRIPLRLARPCTWRDL